MLLVKYKFGAIPSKDPQERGLNTAPRPIAAPLPSGAGSLVSTEFPSARGRRGLGLLRGNVHLQLAVCSHIAPVRGP